MIELNKKFRIEHRGCGFAIIEKLMGKGKKGGMVEVEKISHYGTVHQALRGFLNLTIDQSESMDEVRANVSEAVQQITQSEDLIKEKFRVEVLVARP